MNTKLYSQKFITLCYLICFNIFLFLHYPLIKANQKSQNSSAISYYVDAISGNDSNDGKTTSTAWKTLSKVNSITYTAGNQILFKAGCVWVGQLYPKGSGTSGNPIIIDWYGTGNKPIIDGNGMLGTGIVYLYNQQYWEINNLEITNNSATGGDRRGVRIEANNYGTANHIYLRNLYIHNIKGLVGQDRACKRTSGIGFAIVSATTLETHFNDILVENCIIHDCDNQGIISECVAGDGFQPRTADWNRIKITNAVIRNNTIYNISKNAMIIRLWDKGVVENNVCYNTANGISGNTMFTAACDGTVFQFNEGFLNNSPDADGSMYDADLRSPNTIWQYSYSHDNAHGLFWTCTVQDDANVICRYNISQNDKGIIFCLNYPVTSVHVYNNTVYTAAIHSPILISERNNGGTGTRTYSFKNNIIYNMSLNAVYDFKTSGYTRTIENNCFFGIHPSTEPKDPYKITADPKLISPGYGGIGINSVDAYKIQAGSSCIDKGVIIPDNGGKDYWGNPLYQGKPDIGAHEFTNGTTSVDVGNPNQNQLLESISISPNPIENGNLFIRMPGSNYPDSVNISIHNIIGQIIYNQTHATNKTISINLGSAKLSGIYYVSLIVGKDLVTRKFIIP